MGRVELHSAVARAIADEVAGWCIDEDQRGEIGAPLDSAAAVAVRVVLAEAKRSIEALRDAKIVGAYAIGADDALGEALAALARLEPPPPV